MTQAFDRLRIIEVGEGKALGYAGKLLRDLGAEVIKIESPSGDSMRNYGPFPSDEYNPENSGMFIFLNGGKRGACLDLGTDEGQQTLFLLLDGADVLLHSFQPAAAKRWGLDQEELLQRYPQLIVSAITPYGSTGPYAEWKGYAIQAHSGSTIARRIGDPNREPLTSALDQAEIQHGAVHLAAATALALVHRNRTGKGQFVDVSVLEAVTVAIAGIGIPRQFYGVMESPRERPGRTFAWRPFGLLNTKDGEFAALALLDRQWHSFIEVMGNPAWGNDPRFNTVEQQAFGSLSDDERDEVAGYVEDWFGDRTTAEIWDLTRRARVPFQPVHTVGQVVDSDHMLERGFFVSAPGPHPPLRVPGAPYGMSVTPWEPPEAPPTLDGNFDAEWTSERASVIEGTTDTSIAPLDGLRVIDLGQVWAGPLLGRYLADWGADVILVDTATRPRALAGEFDPTDPIAWEGIHRNRRSVQIDLRTSRGVELLKDLLGSADVMIDNFTPRVLPNLGLNYEDLATEFPRLILAALSAAGRTGPWSDLLSYGPTLTGLYGVKVLNGYPENKEVMEDASDLDPISGTYGMLAIMAALNHRDRTGEGQMIEIAQGEAGFIASTEAMIEYVWNGRDIGPRGNLHRVLAPHGLYPCAGDDAWIAIACGSDEEWAALARVAGHPEWLNQPEFLTADARLAARMELDAEISDWTKEDEPMVLTQQLQDAGVAAFPAMNIFDTVSDPQHSHRREHFDLGGDFPTEMLLDGSPWHLSEARPRLRVPTPVPGQHSDEVFGELLGLSPEDVRTLQAEGVVA